jgi:ribonuclease H-related protein
MKSITIYVDGSHSSKYPDVTGWGIVAVEDNRMLYTDSGIILDPTIVCANQIGGEVKAAMKAIHYAICQGYEEVVVMYDYAGIKGWGELAWKAKEKVAVEYKGWISKQIGKIKIVFKHVGAGHHTGFNAVADNLAKEAILRHTNKAA